jgi:hypothetical protein
LALVVVLAILAVHALTGSPNQATTPATTQATPSDIVPTATKSPTPTPAPTYDPRDIPISQPVVWAPAPTVHVAKVVATAASTTTQIECLPTEAQPYLISARIYITNPIGGTVTYHWRSSDGFISVPQTVYFAPGQTSKVVTDTWTLGAGNANGHRRWEEAVITSPQSFVSNPASFVYVCPAIVSHVSVQAVLTTPDCTNVEPGYDITATITIFAPAGGSVTYTWEHTNGTGTYTQAQTIVIPPGEVLANAIARWHIGGGTSNLPEGVTVVTSTGQVLTTPVVQQTGPSDGTGTPTPTPSATPTCETPTPTPTPTPETVDGITIDGATASANPTAYNCPTITQPQQFIFTGQVAVTAAAGGTITYHWVRPDGTLGPDQTAQIHAGDTLINIPADTPWIQAPNPANGTYGEQLVITAINTTTLSTPFTSTYGQYAVLC